MASRMRPGGGAQFLCVKPAIPHNLRFPHLFKIANTIPARNTLTRLPEQPAITSTTLYALERLAGPQQQHGLSLLQCFDLNCNWRPWAGQLLLLQVLKACRRLLESSAASLGTTEGVQNRLGQSMPVPEFAGGAVILAASDMRREALR